MSLEAPKAAVPLDDLYRRHGHLVIRRARRLLGNEDDARDVLQEIFADLLQRPGQFRAESAFTTYLYGRTTFACLNRLRSSRRHAALLSAEPTATAPSGSVGPEDAAALRALLRDLPEELAPVAVYRYLDGLSHAEMADTLGVSRRQVVKQLARLDKHLARARRSP